MNEGILKLKDNKISHINFKCTRCGKCCEMKDELLLVTISLADLIRISEFLKISRESFLIDYCDWIGEVLGLKIKDSHCIFFDLQTRSCIINDAKPEQCASFPFWKLLVHQPGHAEWVRFLKFCPGFGSAETVSEVDHSKLWSFKDAICKPKI